MEAKTGGVALVVAAWLVATGVWAVPPVSAQGGKSPVLPSALEQRQRAFFERDPYCHHVLAIDADGNALLPRVTPSLASDGTRRYEATTELLAGEDTRGAKLDVSRLRELLDDSSGGGNPDGEALRNVVHGRRQLYLYFEAMFRDIARQRPDEVVVHVHGGLNNIHGAIAKTALIADQLQEQSQREGRRIYYIGICWNSDLFPTYKDHLLSVREGLHQPGKALVTAPAMLLSDLGGAASRLPLNLINFLYQDAYTVRSRAFKRTQLAQTRIEQIQQRAAQPDPPPGVTVSPADDLRPESLRQRNFAQWLVTQPTKIPTTFFLDWLGTGPWKNMLRRTRTMFERESEFIPNVTFQDAVKLADFLSTPGAPTSPDTLLDQMNATGRTGAMALFCERVQSRLAAGGWRPRITLIGHSMGAIVACEILQRFHRLPLDQVVFMGAACSVRDFKTRVIPYLQEQNLRESLLAEFGRTYGVALRPAKAETKTRFYNLCLHDAAENGEKNPGELDLVQRGSLLTWIDTLYQQPESENDRTLGRWVNAILSTDNLPNDVVDRITIKEFGVDRPLAAYPQFARYAYVPDGNQPTLQEPVHHGDFGRFAAGRSKETTNLAFWREIYRLSEVAAMQPEAAKSTRVPRVSSPRRMVAKPRPRPQPALPSLAPGGARDAATGF